MDKNEEDLPPIQIDQLEDQIIDHPDEDTRQQLHDTSLDETFQQKLSAKAKQFDVNNEKQFINSLNDLDLTEANEFGSGKENHTNNTNGSSLNYQFLMTKSHLEFVKKEFYDLQQEISEWFSYNDLKTLGGLDRLTDIYEKRNDIKNIARELNEMTIDNNLVNLKSVLYYSFGEYATKSTPDEQLGSITNNNLKLIKLELYRPLVRILKDFMMERIRVDTTSSSESVVSNKIEETYFRILTLIFFMTLVSLYNKDNLHVLLFKSYLSKVELTEIIIQFIEHWKWYKNSSYRIRHVITLLNKLIILEMGDSDHLKNCDNFLNELHNVRNNLEGENGKTKLTLSPLDYFSFREDLLDKYPLFDYTKEQLNNNSNQANNNAESIEKKYQYFMAINNFSSSLSNIIEPPKTNKSHTVLSQLPAQHVHIATPLPSPKLMSSEYMSGGEKIRKSYQVNQSMPFIYPNDEEKNSSVPLAIVEADEILKNSIYENYSLKRLWNERDKFMKQERGYETSYADKDEFDYNFEVLIEKFPSKTKEIESLKRVESFYSKTYFRLSSIIEVFMEVLKNNRIENNLTFYELELNSSTSFIVNSPLTQENEKAKSKIESVLLAQLEVMNIKEILTKTTTGIILSLLRWFKISHVLKYYYLSTILFDQQFFIVALDFISTSFNNVNNQSIPQSDSDKRDELIEYEILINQNKLMNPQIILPKLNFFNRCLEKDDKEHTYKFTNNEFISGLPKKLDTNNINNVYIKNYNVNFATILSNLLIITNKILIKNQIQRIFIINDLKPSELFKMILINYDNEHFTKPILKILKKLVPYQGRKWKSNNMDLISLIYLNCRLSLKDNWLSGKDLENDFNISLDQEIALRGLLQFYHLKRYDSFPLGYRLDKTDELSATIPKLDLSK
ncbi:FAR11 [Candida pseudojiufengensis]|uniref:FAR11 n=1 Tax=Candida pseudojiufengensis TaxID=497109 RepID=UPI0022246EAA|nr:FAR11 [Candida pseudojiufengensis]KAI5959761.1 FAR11 [Candida pseudojiufengensis]